jgi:hypothetical protein
VKCPQTTKCILRYNSPILFCNFKTQARKHFILNNITNGITSLKKHVNVDHSIKAKMFEEEVNSPFRGEEDQIHLVVQLSIFLLPKILSKMIICNKNFFLRIWVCWLLKIICICNLWKIYGWNASICICVQNLSFFPKTPFSQEMFPELVEKTKQLHVLLALAKCNFLIMNFDLCMS